MVPSKEHSGRVVGVKECVNSKVALRENWGFGVLWVTQRPRKDFSWLLISELDKHLIDKPWLWLLLRQGIEPWVQLLSFRGILNFQGDDPECHGQAGWVVKENDFWALEVRTLNSIVSWLFCNSPVWFLHCDFYPTWETLSWSLMNCPVGI